MKVEQFRIPFTVKEMEIMMIYIEQDAVNLTDPTYKNLHKKLKGQHFKCAEGLKKPDYVNLNKPKVSVHVTVGDLGFDELASKDGLDTDSFMAEMTRLSAAKGNVTEDRRTVDVIPDVFKRRDDPVDSEAADAASFFNDLN